MAEPKAENKKFAAAIASVTVIAVAIVICILFADSLGINIQTNSEQQTTAVNGDDAEKIDFDPIIYTVKGEGIYLKNANDLTDAPHLIFRDSSVKSLYEHTFYMKKDNSAILFPAGFDTDEDAGKTDIYIYDILEEKAELIAEDVIDYRAGADFSSVIYLRQDSPDSGICMYEYTNGEEVLISEDVEPDFYTTDNCDMVLFYNSENELFLRGRGAQAEEISDSFMSVEYYTGDFSEIIYIEEGSLIKRFLYNGSEAIISNDTSVCSTSLGKGGVGYITQTDRTVHLKDIVIDDMAEQDAGKSGGAVTVRNRIRQAMKEDIHYCETYDVKYYDGKNLLYVGKTLRAAETDGFNDPSAAVVTVLENSAVQRIKISDLASGFTAKQVKSEDFSSSVFFDEAMKAQKTKRYFLREGKPLYEFEGSADFGDIYAYDAESKRFIYCVSDKKSGKGNAYIVSLGDVTGQNNVQVIENRSNSFFPAFVGGSLYYMRDKAGTQHSVLYKDGEVILDNVFDVRVMQDDYLKQVFSVRSGEASAPEYYYFSYGTVTKINIPVGRDVSDLYVYTTDSGNRIAVLLGGGKDTGYILTDDGALAVAEDMLSVALPRVYPSDVL